MQIMFRGVFKDIPGTPVTSGSVLAVGEPFCLDIFFDNKKNPTDTGGT